MILVTGGTGLVGAHLLYYLLQTHKTVRAIHRKTSQLDSVKEVFSFYTSDTQELFKRIEWVEADITEVPALSQVFEGITQVYHCAAFISFNTKHFSALQLVNIEGTANIVNLCLTHKVSKLCYVSSIATLGRSEDGSPIKEGNLWNPEADNSVYSITKYGGEMEVWRGTQEGLNAVIVNPGVILGEGFWHSGSGVILKKAAKGVPFYTEGATGFVDVRDVVQIMIRLMNDSMVNQQFVLVAKNVTFFELLTELSKEFKTPPPRKKLSKWVLFSLSYLDAVSSFLFGTKRFLLKANIRSMYSHPAYDSSKIKDCLAVEFTPLEQTIKRVVGNYPR
jgi:nucleoside-diphosphate-sugar epimerase